jgi:hypothetical protein
MSKGADVLRAEIANRIIALIGGPEGHGDLICLINDYGEACRKGGLRKPVDAYLNKTNLDMTGRHSTESLGGSTPPMSTPSPAPAPKKCPECDGKKRIYVAVGATMLCPTCVGTGTKEAK